MSLAKNLERAAYVATQGARVAWYSAHYMLARRLSGPPVPESEPRFEPRTRPGKRQDIQKAFLDLFAQDRANIEGGLYPAPRDFNPANLISALNNSARFFADLPRVDKRRIERNATEVRKANARGEFPPYYLQNFHYQTGGWLTRESAKIYDTQVEVLFAGAADAMRRVGLGLLSQALRGQDQRKAKVLDVACGNGRFLSQVMEAFPRLAASGLDLSPAYLEEARARLAPWPQVELIAGQAEAIPAEDGAYDAATSVYLFHELPPRVRRDVAKEIARVVKPGGAFVFVDSIQQGESPALDRMLEYFPIGFHEPYFASYQQEELAALFGEAGFTLEETKLAFLTKAMLFRRA
ncbi:MAG TPA: class I SAM-dependent methyltransferase [Caulobacterales bacterium]|nr:class I SAM-dependent methyltransferase [Caulobacterales bacterium]